MENLRILLSPRLSASFPLCLSRSISREFLLASASSFSPVCVCMCVCVQLFIFPLISSRIASYGLRVSVLINPRTFPAIVYLYLFPVHRPLRRTGRFRISGRVRRTRREETSMSSVVFDIRDYGFLVEIIRESANERKFSSFGDF